MPSIDEILKQYIAVEVTRQLVAGVPTQVPPASALPVGPPLDPGQLLSVARAAERLGASRDYVYGCIRAGDLPVIELGHGRQKQRIRVEDLDRFVSIRVK